MAAFSEAEIVSAVRGILPDVQAIVLFGSRAEGAETADSDLDLPF